MRNIIIVAAVLLAGPILLWQVSVDTPVDSRRAANAGESQEGESKVQLSVERPEQSHAPSDEDLATSDDEASANGPREGGIGGSRAQRSVAASFNTKYLDALSFSSVAQEQWASRNGFPSLDDVASAATMSTDELRAKGASGDPVFESLYFDRLLDEGLEQLQLVRDGGSSIDAYLRTAEGRALTSDIRRQSEAVLQSRTPFAAYLLFRYNDEFTGNRHAALAALVLGIQRGDRRLNRIARSYADRNGFPPETLEVLSEYAVMDQQADNEQTSLIPMN